MITQFQILKKKYLYFLIIFIFLGLNPSYSQETNIIQDSLIIEKEKKESVLLDDIKYDATDSIRIDQKNNKGILLIPKILTNILALNFCDINRTIIEYKLFLVNILSFAFLKTFSDLILSLPLLTIAIFIISFFIINLNQ